MKINHCSRTPFLNSPTLFFIFGPLFALHIITNGNKVMKTLLNIKQIAFFFILMLGWMTLKAQQQYEVPGDNFSLEGALEMFKKSASPEEFERMLNDPEARVNNLDLNGDGYIDYVRVIDMYEGNVHVFVIQAVISEKQSQDIAVITLEKLADGKAILQITGDADIYGVETIIEPTTEVRTYAGAQTSRVMVNVWAWPLVRYVYGPYYNVWVSPWGWGYRPYWWSPWRPIVYYDYYSYWRPYWGYYSVCYTHRVYHAHSIYWPHRSTSVIVYNNYHHRIKKYRTTYTERGGRYASRDGRYPSRRSENVRYSADGRIVSNASERISSRSSSGRSVDARNSSARRQSGNTIQRSGDNARRYSGNSITSRNSERTGSGANYRRSDSNSGYRQGNSSTNIERSSRSSSGNSGTQRSAVRPDNGANYRQGSTNSSIQRSAGRSYGNSSTSRSDVRPGNGENYRRANSSGNVQRSTGRSSGNPGIQRSPQRSGSPNSGYSSGSAGSPRSYERPSGNTGSRFSQGNTHGSRSSGSGSSIQRSSGSRSSIQRSSGGSSGGSNSRRSGSTNSGSRGRR